MISLRASNRNNPNSLARRQHHLVPSSSTTLPPSPLSDYKTLKTSLHSCPCCTCEVPSRDDVKRSIVQDATVPQPLAASIPSQRPVAPLKMHFLLALRRMVLAHRVRRHRLAASLGEAVISSPAPPPWTSIAAAMLLRQQRVNPRSRRPRFLKQDESPQQQQQQRQRRSWEVRRSVATRQMTLPAFDEQSVMFHLW